MLPAAAVSALIAFVSALTTLFVAIYSARRSRETQEQIEKLRAGLAAENSKEDARRSYEFHARQRLYQEYEPLRFQLLDAVETAKCQIETMSEQALDQRLRHLGSTPTGKYWLLGTIYHLLRPAAVYRLAQRKLTVVDLRVEPTIEIEYTLAKKVYLALSHDARMAELSSIIYTPYVDGWQEKRELNPARFRRQGLPLGRLDNAVDTLIVQRDGSAERIATFGEFEAGFGASSPDDVSGPIGAARDLFTSFSPSIRPVLWRLLLAQFVMYKALLASIRHVDSPVQILDQPWHHLSHEELCSLGFERGGDRLPEPQDVVRYLGAFVTPDLRSISGIEALPNSR